MGDDKHFSNIWLGWSRKILKLLIHQLLNAVRVYLYPVILPLLIVIYRTLDEVFSRKFEQQQIHVSLRKSKKRSGSVEEYKETQAEERTIFQGNSIIGIR